MLLNSSQFSISPDSQDWAEWLNLIKEQPHQHGYLTKLGNQFRYLNQQERERFQKTGFSVQALNSEKIFEITRGFFQNPTTETEHKQQMLEGLRYIHKERRARYQRLFFICRWFAKWRGAEARLNAEKQEIKQLKSTLQAELRQPIDNQKKSDNLSLEQVKENFDLLSQKFKELKDQKAALPKKQMDNWYETLFMWEKKLEDFKQVLQQAKDPDCWQQMKPLVRALEKELEGWESALPRLRQIAKVMGPQAIKSTLQETLYFLCADKKVTDADLAKDQKLFNLSTIESYAGYVKRILKAERTALSLPLVTAIERVWEEIMRSQSKSEEGKTRILEGYRVIFIPDSKKTYLKEGFTAQGTYKAAFLLTPFHTLKKEEERGSLTILQPNDVVEKEIEEHMRKKEEQGGENSSLRGKQSITQESVDDSNSDSEDEDELKGYQEEAQNCLRYGKLPSVWPTLETPVVDGYLSIIQPTAGYQFKRADGKKATAVTLADMEIFATNKQLTVTDQVVYLKMIGEFLSGVESLHKEKIIHRDLKPDNVLCSKEGGVGVSDLGTLCASQILEKVKDSEEEKWVSNPQKVGIVGTPRYMAPEVICYTDISKAKWETIDLSADIWGVGIIFWELLSGQSIYKHPVFRGIRPSTSGIILLTKMSELLNFRRKSYESDQEPDEKTSLAHLIWHCTRLDPDQRPHIAEVIQRYQAWSKQVIAKLEGGTVKSLDECFNDAV